MVTSVLRVVLLGLMLGAPALLHAQSAASGTPMVGRVVDIRNDRPIAGAQVILERFKVTSLSDSAGAFRVAGVPAGTHEVIVRAIGYEPLVVMMAFMASDTLRPEFLLNNAAQMLNVVKIDTTTGGLLSLRMQEFEDRRKIGLGRFLDASFFARYFGLDIISILNGRFANISATSGPHGLSIRNARGGRSCPAQIVLNGQMMGTVVDRGLIQPESVIGFEFHNSASTPAQYGGTAIGGAIYGSGFSGASCGTAIFWTR
ncbi:carboxypeptidase regulatory-like domain-containing protein [Gemmatimonas sp.]|uniref:carboxypeptidase regulatory-like domain-containing protein n=1 Tax=Gemmatimonas sp. TaxID=1962908 RepID=UPI002EDB940D